MKTAIQAARAWHSKAKDETDDFDRFVYLWFAFNALYNEHLRDSEKYAINSFITEEFYQMRNVRYIINSDSARYFQNRAIRSCKAFDYQDTLFDTNKLRDSRNSDLVRLRALTMILYQVRCNLFHGNKMFSSESDHEIVRHAANVLYDLIGTWV